MRLKRIVNAALIRATGHKLVRADAAPPKRVPKPKPKPAPKPAPARTRGLPKHWDEEAQEIIRAVKPFTMTAPDKLFALILATRYVVDHGVPGSIVECGVWRGGSMQAVAKTLIARGATDRDLHLFDTFEGMPPPSEEDLRHDGKSATELLTSNPKTSSVWAVASLEDVQDGMRQTGYPPDRIHYHRGLVEETIPDGAPDEIAILRLDTDWYESTRHELEHLYDRVPSGGVVVFDDYGFWQGARQAVDEFLERTGERLLLLPMASGRITLKP